MNKRNQDTLTEGSIFEVKKKKKIAATKKREKLRGNSNDNPYLQEVRDLQKTIPNWNNIFSKEADESRIEQFIRLRIIGGSLSDKYSWAVPDKRSLNILKNFAPLVEIGSGLGYWAKLLQSEGVDVLPYDCEVDSDKSWTLVQGSIP